MIAMKKKMKCQNFGYIKLLSFNLRICTLKEFVIISRTK